MLKKAKESILVRYKRVKLLRLEFKENLESKNKTKGRILREKKRRKHKEEEEERRRRKRSGRKEGSKAASRRHKQVFLWS